MSQMPAGERDVTVHPDGAGGELRIVLGPAHGADAAHAALALGFSSALSFDAGLACDDEGRWLLLTRWLDQLDDAPALEAARAALIAQRDSWRALLPAGADDGKAARASRELREQQRLRSLFARTPP